MSTKRVLVAVSGGVDSAVAVHLLRQQGYAVEGIILEFSPAHKAAVEQAKVVAEQLGIRLHVRECHREFEQNVILPFCREYKAGRTPNPCILCNPSTKFGLICQAAKEMGFDFIATGHYARIDHQADGTAVLQKSSCLERDQSYMLYRLSQEQLAMLLLPLEGLEKPQVREIARQLGLVCADAPDSQEICWLPDGDYAAFIRARGIEDKAGRFIGPDGEDLGAHRGVSHYTVGQRKGLGVAYGEPVFVRRILPGGDIQLARSGGEFYAGVTLRDAVRADGGAFSPGEALEVKIRSRAQPAPCTVQPMPDGALTVRFDSPLRAPAPGQSAVFYAADGLVVGGGVIDTLLET